VLVTPHRMRSGLPGRHITRGQPPRAGGNWAAVAGLACCEIAGMAAVVKSYEVALTTVSSEAEFVWFWLGMLLIELPIAGIIARRGTSRAVRTALLMLLGMLTYAPKLLRDPTSPAYHDEFAHWRATYDILSSGKLFQQVPIIPILSRYPGLHAATAALVNLTGLTIWHAATLLLLVLHVSLILGMAALAQSIGLSSRAAAVAAIIYSFNSSFLYFDTQFGYESMAITLLVWALVAFTQATRARRGRERVAWGGVAVLLSVGTVVTHHLSAINLTIIMTLISLGLSVPRLAKRDGWSRTASTAWLLTLVTALALSAWIYFVAPGTVSYLSPFLGAGLSQLLHIASGSSSGRQLFSQSLSPSWEHQAAFLVILIAFILAAAGLVLMVRQVRNNTLPRGRRRSLFVAFTVLGLVYFPSTLFILSPSGAEGARRSWAITWIGLSIAIAPVTVWLLELARRRAHIWSRIGWRTGLAAAMAISLTGGTAAGLDASYRFPGPFLYGSEARSDSPELDAMSQWFLDRFGPKNNVVTDRYTGLIIGSFGLQYTANPSSGFPVYDLYTDEPGKPLGPAFLLAELASSKYLYLIVDERMADHTPAIGVYFEGDDTGQFALPDGKPIFQGRLGKFNSTLWMYKVFQSDNYSVYRMNLPAGPDTYQRTAVNFTGKLTVRQ
jgi:hypothetical protein